MTSNQFLIRHIRYWLIQLSESKFLTSILIGFLTTLLILARGEVPKVLGAVIVGFFSYALVSLFFWDFKVAVISYSSIALHIWIVYFVLSLGSWSSVVLIVQGFLTAVIILKALRKWPRKDDDDDDHIVGTLAEKNFVMQQWVEVLCRLPSEKDGKIFTWEDKEGVWTWEDEKDNLEIFIENVSIPEFEEEHTYEIKKNTENIKEALELAAEYRKENYKFFRRFRRRGLNKFLKKD